MNVTVRTIRPQPGPQERFLASSADIVIYGGAAGGGKTWALLMEATRHVANPGFGAVIFRRNSTQVRSEGGLWDESVDLYMPLGADPKQSTLDWVFPSGARVSFRHLEHEKTKYDWQGSQIPLICFDELTHFSAGQFWYMLSRNRSMSGVRPYVRATCNPDADSWVASFIGWWIDQGTGLPIYERSGVVRHFIRVGDDIIWGDNPSELASHLMPDGTPIPSKSVTFIPASLSDNAALMAADPGYMANLLALSRVERERLLTGNWKVRATAGLFFQRSWFRHAAAAPEGTKWVRAWDLAASTGPNSAWTVGVLMGKDPAGQYYVADVQRMRGSPMDVEKTIVRTAQRDGPSVHGDLPQDPGQAGKAQVQYLVRQLRGYPYRYSPETGDKTTRAQPFSAQVEAGNVFLLPGDWHEAYLTELEAFPDGAFVDQVDASSRAFAAVSNRKRSILDVV